MFHYNNQTDQGDETEGLEREGLQGEGRRVYRVPGFLSSRPNWVPTPSAARECCSSPLWVRGGDTLACGERGEGTQIRRRDTLWYMYTIIPQREEL
jgi:hypothetical protein